MKLLATIIPALITLALAASPARAQAGASCPVGAPTIVTATTYALTNDDTCRTLVFTSASPATVTAPNANTVAPGYQAMLFSVSGGLTLTSSASKINRATTGVMIGGGQSGMLYGDGSNYFWSVGAGFASTAPDSGFSTLGVSPGTLAATSGIVALPNNAMLQFTNEASFRPGSYPFDHCRNAPMTVAAGLAGAPRTGFNPLNWLQILDNVGKPRLIALCSP